MRSFARVLVHLIPFIAGLLLSEGALAQGASDSGQWQILNARYGTFQRNIDVTQRLRELARNDVAFRVTNDTFGGDPHPNAVKTLRIQARGPGGATRTFEYAENQFVQGTMFVGWSGGNWGQGGGNAGWGDQGNNRPVDSGQWQILQARYGTAQRNIDVTQQLRALAKRQSDFRVSNDLFGRDPHPGVEKTLRIQARGPGGATRTFDYAESHFVHGAMFSGWSSGDWGEGGGNAGWGDEAGQRPGGGGQWQILQARYGTAQRNVDVTQRLRDLAGRQSSFRVGNDLFGGDPQPGVAKTLRVYARGPNGATRTFDYPENEFIHGDLFAGWTGANWGRASTQAGADSGW